MRRSSYPPRRRASKSHTRGLFDKRPPLVLRTRRPLAAVIVTIDAAKRSGCATFALGKLLSHSQIKAHERPHERLHFLELAIKHAYLLAVPCGLVLEVPWGGFRAAQNSLTASAALWRDSWLQLGRDAEHVLEVEAGEWRRALFGTGSIPREAQQRIEALTAAQVAKLHPAELLTAEAIGSDAAAAICLGVTCTHSLDLQKALGCQLCAVP
jgi:hypothetical protein